MSRTIVLTRERTTKRTIVFTTHEPDAAVVGVTVLKDREFDDAKAVTVTVKKADPDVRKA